MKRETMIVAHRGASGEAPENTVEAVLRGWEEGADAAEIDVHLTRDGEVVVIHDATLLRTTGRDARVDALTLAEIRKLDAGIWKGAAWRGVRVPTLADVLATVPEGKRIFIELKEADGLVPALARTVEASALKPEQVVLIGFAAAALGEAKRVMKTCRTLLLADTPEGAEERRAALIALCVKEGFDGLGVSAGWPIDRGLVERLAGEGLELNVWTVNDPVRAKALVAAGVATITTDRPGWLRGKLAAKVKD